ncbi:hypothetical protein MRX96_022922 [Rhipicephalus microplus]
MTSPRNADYLRLARELCAHTQTRHARKGFVPGNECAWPDTPRHCRLESARLERPHLERRRKRRQWIRDRYTLERDGEGRRSKESHGEGGDVDFGWLYLSSCRCLARVIC